ncbi:MAG: PaaI family thioesterase [Pseudomonadota bacterium]
MLLRDAHCNSRGMVHGGLIAALCDNGMGLTCVAAMKDNGRELQGMVTVSMTTDFLGAAEIGSWLIVAPEAVKLGGSLGFARALVTADGKPIAQASASFRIS